MFVDSVASRFKEDCELVGICDTNPGRLAYYNRYIVRELGGEPVPAFAADDFDAMVRQTRPDTVIVTTVDAFHHEYIVRAMELGCDAITEKPMTIDAEKCGAILGAIDRTGRELRVAFNYRWRPGCTLVRRLLQEGTIGDIVHVDMEYLLDTDHGADYFRRWHRQKDKSGGLLVHKGTHHFDLVNWWLDAVPETVFGMGRLAFYGRENAERRGVKVGYDRYTGHDTEADPFAIDLSTAERTRGMYLEAEEHDGYRRDQNVFGDGVSIEDTMSLLVRYRTGVVLNYSLNAYMPREGFSIAFNGTKGRLEYQEAHGTDHAIGDERRRDGLGDRWTDRLVVLPHFGEPYEVPIPAAEGAHGGGDPPLQEQIFSGSPPPEPWRRIAGHGQGAASIMVGIAGNRSFETGRPESVAELCPGLGNARQLSELP
jgi:predicted dehydrogenase